MIKISLHEDINDILIIGRWPPKDRKYSELFQCSYLFPNTDVAAWLKERNINYRVGHTVDDRFVYDWYIEFDNNEDAFLFKLTWY
jgi:hypothetical protein